MKNINTKEFGQIYNTETKENLTGSPMVVDFFAEWCGPCKAFAPVLTEVSEELGIQAYKVNVDDEPELAQAFNIRSLPTILIIDGGGDVTVSVGQTPKADIQNKIKTICGL